MPLPGDPAWAPAQTAVPAPFQLTMTNQGQEKDFPDLAGPQAPPLPLEFWPAEPLLDPDHLLMQNALGDWYHPGVEQGAGSLPAQPLPSLHQQHQHQAVAAAAAAAHHPHHPLVHVGSGTALASMVPAGGNGVSTQPPALEPFAGPRENAPPGPRRRRALRPRSLKPAPRAAPAEPADGDAQPRGSAGRRRPAAHLWRPAAQRAAADDAAGRAAAGPAGPGRAARV